MPAKKAAAKKKPEAVPGIKAWSYSRYSTHRECPRKAKYKFVDKMKEPDGKATGRGTAVHLAGEKFLRHELRTPSEDYAKFKAKLQKLRKDGAFPEQQVAFTDMWEQCDWFAGEAWVRIKFDAVVVDGKRATVVDFKTGQEYQPDHEEQLELYAVAVFLVNDEVETVEAVDWYLDGGHEFKRTYVRKQLATLMRQWEKKARPMLTDTVYPTRPSWRCKKCHFSKANGGPCEF